MKKRLILFTCLVVAIIISGCAKNIEKSINDRGPLVERTYVATIAQDTKTSIDSEDKVFWEPRDIIRYYSCDGDMPAYHSVPAKGASTYISAQVPMSDPYFIAFYGEGELSENKAASFVLADAVKGAQDGTFEKAHISAAKTSDVSSTEIFFSNVTSLIKFSLTRTDVKTMTFTANDGKRIYGSIRVNFDKNNKPSAEFTEQGGNSSINVKIGMKQGTFYIATLPRTIKNGFTCEFYDADGKKLGVAKSNQDLVIGRNRIINLGNIDEKITAPEYQDLSAKEAANCYIVTSVGDFKFNAGFKGNSNEQIGEAVSAKVLWESRNTPYLIAQKEVIKDVEYTDGYIKFTSVADGNASVAVLAGDGETILWSWHIWVSLGYDAYASGQDYRYRYSNPEIGEDAKYVIGRMMDRNLGALSNVPGDAGVYGLMYEWGRKDPFLGYNTSASIILPAPEECSETTGTVDWAVAHPTTYIYGTTANSRDWLYTDHDNTLWGSDKTKYDPCPPGWKVPESLVWPLAYGSDNAEMYHFDIEHYGMDFGRYFGPDAHIWYPAAGYRDPNQKGYPQNLSRYGFWWTSTGQNNNTSYIFKIVSADEFTPRTTSPRSFGNSVRCIATSEPDPVLVTDIEISPKPLSLNLYHFQQMSCTIVPSNADHQTVTWSSSNPAIASVDPLSGLVTACGVGTCTISAVSEDGPSDRCEVTVSTASMVDLSSNGTANSYLVSTPGTYKFKADVKGNSNESIQNGAKVKVLWESYGNNIPPYSGDIVSNVSYKNGYITFDIPASMRNGNALIAVVNNSDEVLWSWHIWAFKGYDLEKYAQTYKNGAVMMSCNLGALSLAEDNVQSLGLMYQWGRKDPFLAGGTLSGKTPAASTLVWPGPVSSSSVEYSIKNPTTFILGGSNNNDWAINDNSERWSSSKTKYDPCPPGWRVPDGGASGVWGSNVKDLYIENKGLWDESVNVCRFSDVFGEEQIWYPSSGYRYHKDGAIYGQTQYEICWAVNVKKGSAGNLYFCRDQVLLNNNSFKATGAAVRCVKEGTYTAKPVTGISIKKVEGSEYLTEKGNSIVLEAVLSPSDASYQYVIWDNFNPDQVEMKVGDDVYGKKVTFTRVCEQDFDEPITVQVMSPDGELYGYYIIYCGSRMN